jgi:hypothetical protein
MNKKFQPDPYFSLIGHIFVLIWPLPKVARACGCPPILIMVRKRYGTWN